MRRISALGPNGQAAYGQVSTGDGCGASLPGGRIAATHRGPWTAWGLGQTFFKGGWKAGGPSNSTQELLLCIANQQKGAGHWLTLGLGRQSGEHGDKHLEAWVKHFVVL